MRYNLYTYRNKQDFDEIDENYDVITCSINDLANTIDFSDYDYVDISLVIQNLINNPSNSSFIMNLESFLKGYGEVIIRENLAEIAINFCYFLFDSYSQLDFLEDNNSFDNEKILYTYNPEIITELINYFNNNNEEFIRLEHFQIQEMLNILSINFNKEIFIDISILDGFNNLTFLEEFIKIFSSYSNVIFIVDNSTLSNTFRFYFDHFQDISDKLSNFYPKFKSSNESNMTIMDFDNSKLVEINKSFNNEFFGHSNFKIDLFKSLNEFYYLNKLGLKKIFSIFLLGNSGLGKTEVARLLSKNINKDLNLIKINFGNYSSNDALNSLIGSPRGYIGSQNGELSIKLKKPHTGIILCDEFEKADGKVFNFFLELLEEGKFTDSQSIEYNLNGFIIIFTSNLNRNQFYEKIPHEFISRLDLVSLFDNLPLSEKERFVNFQINNFWDYVKNNKEDIDLNLDNLDLSNFKLDFDLNSTENIRDIKREINNQLIDRLKEDI